MKIGDYNFTAYKIKTKESALRQIDRAWEINKELLTTRWLEKTTIAGRMPINKTLDGLYNEFKRNVLKEMSEVFGGNNIFEDDVDVNTAIERVLRSKTFQSKEQLLKTNMLSRLDGSLALRQLQRIDPSITASDIIQNAKYIQEMKAEEGLGDFGQMDEDFDEYAWIEEICEASACEFVWENHYCSLGDSDIYFGIVWYNRITAENLAELERDRREYVCDELVRIFGNYDILDYDQIAEPELHMVAQVY